MIMAWFDSGGGNEGNKTEGEKEGRNDVKGYLFSTHC